MSRSRCMSALCIVVVTMLAGTPVLAAVCEEACSHTGSTNEASASTSPHHHHATATHVHDSHVSGVMNAACERDCCRDVEFRTAAVVAGRIDTGVLAAPTSLIPALVAVLPAGRASVAAPPRGAPPGRSPDSARPLPLRI